MKAIQVELYKSLAGRGIIVAFLCAGLIACRGGMDDFSRGFSKAIGFLLGLVLLDILFGVVVLVALQGGRLTVSSGNKIFAVSLKRWCFVVFLPGSPNEAQLSVYDMSGMLVFIKVISMSRKLFCGPDALGRTRVVLLPSVTSEIRLIENLAS